MDKKTEFIESLIDKTKQYKILWYECYDDVDDDESLFYTTDSKTVDGKEYNMTYFPDMQEVYLGDESVPSSNVTKNYWLILKQTVENQIEERENEKSKKEKTEWDKRQDKLLDIGLSW